MVDESVLDFHTYLGQDAHGDHSQTVDELIATMDACRINQAVVTRFLDFPGPDPQIHRALYESWRRFPERLIPFA